MNVLSRSGSERLKEDDLHKIHLQTAIGTFAVMNMPQRHQPANMLGLHVLEQ